MSTEVSGPEIREKALEVTAELVEIYRCVARCPDCQSDAWEITVDKPGDFEKITGIVCCGCALRIPFEMDAKLVTIGD